MQTQMNLHILGGSRGTMDNGAKYASVFVTMAAEHEQGGTSQRYGNNVMKVNCDYAAFDMLQDSHFPGDFDCTATLKPGPGGTSKLHIQHMKPVTKPMAGKAA